MHRVWKSDTFTTGVVSCNLGLLNRKCTSCNVLGHCNSWGVCPAAVHWLAHGNVSDSKSLCYGIPNSCLLHCELYIRVRIIDASIDMEHLLQSSWRLFFASCVFMLKFHCKELLLPVPFAIWKFQVCLSRTPAVFLGGTGRMVLVASYRS